MSKNRLRKRVNFDETPRQVKLSADTRWQGCDVCGKGTKFRNNCLHDQPLRSWKWHRTKQWHGSMHRYRGPTFDFDRLWRKSRRIPCGRRNQISSFYTVKYGFMEY